MSRGYFITLEGGEGAGKSTHTQTIKNFLASKGIDLVLTREPGGSDGGERIRPLLVQGTAGQWDALTEYLLFSAARRDHIERLLKPALSSGKWVLCDRFYDSSVAYQGYGGGVSLSFLETVYREIAGHFEPDLTFLFDLPPEIGLSRARSRNDQETRFEEKEIAFHERLRRGFLEITKGSPSRFEIIRAEDPKDVIAERILQVLTNRFF